MGEEMKRLKDNNRNPGLEGEGERGMRREREQIFTVRLKNP